MKTLLAIALSLAAFNSFARVPTQGCPGSDFSKYLAIGSYEGKSDRGESCQVIVSNNGSQDVVEVISGNNDVIKVITQQVARCNGPLKIFTQTDHVNTSSDGINYYENIIYVNLTSNNKLNVETSYMTVENTDSNTTTAQCVIDL